MNDDAPLHRPFPISLLLTKITSINLLKKWDIFKLLKEVVKVLHRYGNNKIRNFSSHDSNYNCEMLIQKILFFEFLYMWLIFRLFLGRSCQFNKKKDIRTLIEIFPSRKKLFGEAWENITCVRPRTGSLLYSLRHSGPKLHDKRKVFSFIFYAK